MSAANPGLQPADRVRPTEHVRGVHRRRDERFLGGEVQLRAGEREDEGKAVAERTARVEVGRERDQAAGVRERPGRWHRSREEERARRQQHARDVARGETSNAGRPRRFEVIDRSRAKLDRELDRAGLGELVAVQPQREAGLGARLEIPTRLRCVERSPLEEDVGGLRDPRLPPAEPPREGSPRRRPPIRTRAARCGRRATWALPRPHEPPAAARARCRGRGRSPTSPRTSSCRERASMLDAAAVIRGQLGLVGSARRPHRREDAAAGRVKLLVRRSACPERELVDPIATEARVCVAVDEARDGAEPATVDLPQIGGKIGGKIGHPPDASTRPSRHRTYAPSTTRTSRSASAAQRPSHAGRRRDLGEVANEQVGHRPSVAVGSAAGGTTHDARQIEPPVACGVERLGVAGVGVAHDACPGVGGEHARRADPRHRTSRPRARPCRCGSSCRSRRRRRDAR